MAGAPHLALLHTGAAHQPTFAGLLAQIAPDLPARHRVRADLLNDSIAAGGVTDEVRERLAAELRAARADGARAVLCTCSTIGAAAEAAGRALDLPVLRVDRPMAERAVAAGRRICVAACLQSTVAPTSELLRAVAAAAGREIALSVLLIPEAWKHFESGDHHAYACAIAERVRAEATDCDAVVLAQASMAPAAALCADLGVPVLSSPGLGVEGARALWEGAAR